MVYILMFILLSNCYKTAATTTTIIMFQLCYYYYSIITKKKFFSVKISAVSSEKLDPKNTKKKK